MTIVVNKYKDPDGIYIGRGTIFGNPYEIGVDGTREEVIEKYKKWFNFLLRDKFFKQELLKLKNKKLVCFCSPKLCHGDIIANYLNNI